MENQLRLEYDLQFFAQDGPGGEKTETATQKKLTDARKDGKVAKSTELNTAVLLLSFFLAIKFFVNMMGERFLAVYRDTFQRLSIYANGEFNYTMGNFLFADAIMNIFVILLPVLVISVVTGFIVNLYQVKWQPTAKPLKPKLENLNPVKGFKNLLSKDKLVELFKSILKISAISYVVYDALKDEWNMLLTLYSLPFDQAIGYIGNTVIDIGLKISYLFLVIGLADIFYQKHKFKEEMKMTKQEIKDEYKNSEGDPQIKGQIRGKMREASQRRMMQSLPQADVVITNPTHLAVAIKYDKEKSSAPMVIAKGADYMAQKIKDAAKEYKIEIVENKPLARMLYYNVDVDQEIPQELYQMVAEVLAYVYSLNKDKHPDIENW